MLVTHNHKECFRCPDSCCDGTEEIYARCQYGPGRRFAKKIYVGKDYKYIELPPIILQGGSPGLGKGR